MPYARYNISSKFRFYKLLLQAYAGQVYSLEKHISCYIFPTTIITGYNVSPGNKIY